MSSVSLAQPKIRLGPHQNLGFSFGLVFTENHGFVFKTDPALVYALLMMFSSSRNVTVNVSQKFLMWLLRYSSRTVTKSVDGRLCVCLFVPHRITTRLHGLRCNLAEWGGVPSSCVLLGGFAIWVRGFHCYDNITPNTKCQQVLVLTLRLVLSVDICL